MKFIHVPSSIYLEQLGVSVIDFLSLTFALLFFLGETGRKEGIVILV